MGNKLVLSNGIYLETWREKRDKIHAQEWTWDSWVEKAKKKKKDTETNKRNLRVQGLKSSQVWEYFSEMKRMNSNQHKTDEGNHWLNYREKSFKNL